MTKRDGTTPLFDSSKIVRMLEGAVPTDLPEHTQQEIIDLILSKFKLTITSGIKTSEIQDKLINTVVKLIDVDSTFYGDIAGKLYTSKLIKEVVAARGFEFGNLAELYRTGLVSGLYQDFDPKTLAAYYYILNCLEPILDKSKNYMYNYTAVTTFKKRYLQPNETVVEVFALIAARLVLHLNIPIEDKVDLATQYLSALCDNKVSLATPILMNLRLKNGNLTSCFVGEMPDNMEGIYDEVKGFALVSKNGGGQGLYIGNLRAKGSAIKGVDGLADSVIPVATVLNQTALFSNQNGKRAGAITVAIPMWHNDIHEYLELQTETGDTRRKAFDIFLQVIQDDKFLECLENNTDYVTVCPHEVKTKLGIDLNARHSNFKNNFELLMSKVKDGTLKVGTILRARSLFKAQVNALLIKGTPYVFYTDNVNVVNPMKDVGDIKCSNLCQESTSYFDEDYTHTCNLISIVLPNLEKRTSLFDSSKEDISKDLRYTSKLAVRMLDAIVDITVLPTEKSARHNRDFRVLGVGMLGLHDYLAYNNLNYNDVDEIELLSEQLALYTLQASVSLAKELGTFPRYAESTWAKGQIYSRDLDWYKDNSQLYSEWVKVYSRAQKYGVRNLQLLAYAPNSSTSLIMGVTAGVMPVYSKYYADSTSTLGTIAVYPKYLHTHFIAYKEYRHHDIYHMNKVIGRMTKWVDSGISYEWSLDISKIGIKDLMNYYIDAHRQGVKTIYYVRWSTSDEEICTSCAN